VARHPGHTSHPAGRDREVRSALVELGVEDLVDRTFGAGRFTAHTRRVGAEHGDVADFFLYVELGEPLADGRIGAVTDVVEKGLPRVFGHAPEQSGRVE